jgi:hypothetical protein
MPVSLPRDDPAGAVRAGPRRHVTRRVADRPDPPVRQRRGGERGELVRRRPRHAGGDGRKPAHPWRCSSSTGAVRLPDPCAQAIPRCEAGCRSSIATTPRPVRPCEMALGWTDSHIVRPWSDDETMYRATSEFLSSWMRGPGADLRAGPHRGRRRQRPPGPGARRADTVRSAVRLAVAAGDGRKDSLKRVASAAGEGAKGGDRGAPGAPASAHLTRPGEQAAAAWRRSGVARPDDARRGCAQRSPGRPV